MAVGRVVPPFVRKDGRGRTTAGLAGDVTAKKPHTDIVIRTNVEEEYTDLVGAHLEVEAWLRQMMARVKERSEMLTDP